MILITLLLLTAIAINIALGITVYLTNRLRKANQSYLVSATFMTLWLIANLFILYSGNEAEAIIRINTATALAACIPTSFQLIRLSITSPDLSWPSLFSKCKPQLIFNVLAILLCSLPTFTMSVAISESGSMSLVQPKYGPPFIFFLLYMLSSIGVISHGVFHDRKDLKGNQRLELEFLVFACLSGLCVGILLGTIVALLSKTSIFVPVANATSVLTVSAIVAYGIAMHKILAVSTLLRKLTAYAMLSVYLSIVYSGTYGITHLAFTLLGIPKSLLNTLLPTLAVAFSMIPARNHMQKATELLFGSGHFDIQSTLKKASDIFQSVSTITSLLDHFSKLLMQSFNVERVIILTPQNTLLTQDFPVTETSKAISFAYDNALITMLKRTREPICADSLIRVRETPETIEILSTLKECESSVAAGVFSKSHIKGIVLFGARYRGHAYDKAEQEAIQILCNQFAVALENAELYTEMQDSKIRNEIMLDQLVSGVVLANTDRKLTLFNHEAQRITGIHEQDAIGKNIDILPKPIWKALENALQMEHEERNIEARLFEQDETKKSLSIRMGTTFLLGHDETPMGALLVFTDMTELKSLEEQVRRADQLSSVGTLAAGMAHEIKNPLVTIKTFTQLLPQRYADEDFRHDFASLVAHEVSRIDGIVNELLSFSKPTKPHLVPMNLHQTIDQILKLTHEQMVQRNITVINKYKAEIDNILGDAKLLSQALINLTLNAIEAIGSDGTITIGTSNCTYRFANGDTPSNAVSKKSIRIQISDTGKGIPRESLQKIFDPFFTSKSEGTGMGLSVAHGIINEHHGVIEVESEIGRGTTFYLYIPALDEVPV